jgi:hypothetical protein
VQTVIPSTTVTTGPNTSFHVGDTVSISNSITYGQAVLQTSSLDVTLDGVDDPSSVISADPPTKGDKTVDLNVTLTNVGNSPFPMVGEGAESTPALLWALNPEFRNASYEGPYEYPGPPAANCQGTARDIQSALDPGQSVSGCVLFNVPDTLTVTSASAQVYIGGQDSPGTSEVWSIP